MPRTARHQQLTLDDLAAEEMERASNNVQLAVVGMREDRRRPGVVSSHHRTDD